MNNILPIIVSASVAPLGSKRLYGADERSGEALGQLLQIFFLAFDFGEKAVFCVGSIVIVVSIDHGSWPQVAKLLWP